MGQQRSRLIRLIFITAGRFLASKNQIHLVILELGDLGHGIGSFSHTQYYASAGQLKVNNNGFMCQMSMKPTAMLDRNSPTFDKVVEIHMTTKMLSKLDLEPKDQGG